METKKIKKPISKLLIKRLHVLYHRCGIDEEQKRTILMDLTDGRTNSTKELSYSEGMYLLGYLNGAHAKSKDLGIGERSIKYYRSAVLKRIQKLGVDTTNWVNVNRFLRNHRIAGKPLYELDGEELLELIPKLESIIKKRNYE